MKKFLLFCYVKGFSLFNEDQRVGSELNIANDVNHGNCDMANFSDDQFTCRMIGKGLLQTFAIFL